MLAVLHYFSEHYPEPITIPGLSRQLGISLVHIEIAFDVHKGITTNHALLEYRLNRLCDLMHRDPSCEISVQINQCGLGSGPKSALADFHRTNHQFIASFGIDLIAYHQQCFLAQAARLQRDGNRINAVADALVGSPSRENRLLTRFHHPA